MGGEIAAAVVGPAAEAMVEEAAELVQAGQANTDSKTMSKH